MVLDEEYIATVIFLFLLLVLRSSEFLNISTTNKRSSAYLEYHRLMKICWKEFALYSYSLSGVHFLFLFN